MARQTSRSRTTALLLVAAGAVLGPVLLAGPASAESALPDEPPGGATCAPGIPATDCQQEGVGTPTPSGTPTETPTATPRPTASAAPAENPTTIPVTGGQKPSTSQPQLAHTGPAQTTGYAAVGIAFLVLGSGLAAAGRRTVRA